MNPWGLLVGLVALVLIVAGLRNDMGPVMTKLRGSPTPIPSSGSSSGSSSAALTSSGAALPTGHAGGGAPALVQEAYSWSEAQVPYVWGGASRLGADCSGYVQQLFAGIGIPVGRTTYAQVGEGQAVPTTLAGVPSLAAARPGDVLFFGNNSHEGLYLGNGMMTDEPHTGGHAEIVPVAGYGQPDAIRRFLATGATVSAAPMIPGAVL